MPQFSIIAVAGKEEDLKQATNFPPFVVWDKIVRVPIPSDHGQFPDTSGYTSKNWENLSSNVEDCQLHPYMQKCVDAVVDYTTKRSDALVRMQFQDVKTSIHGTNVGGDMFVIAGFVDFN